MTTTQENLQELRRLGLARPQWARLAQLSTLAAILALIVTWYFSSFAGMLVAFFALLTGLFHWAYFAWTWITPRHVRLVDYPYLLAGGFGILLLAYQGQKDRDDYFLSLLPDTVGELHSFTQQSIARLCRPPSGWKHPEAYCRWAERLDAFLATNPTVAALDAKRAESEALAQREGWTPPPAWYAPVFPPRAIAPSPNAEDGSRPATADELRENMLLIETRMARRDADAIIRTMRKLVRIAAPASSGSRTHENSVLYRLVLWPFLIAAALALRLTKVTADVAEWPTRPREK